MERGDLTAVYFIGENPVQSEADQKRATHLLEGLDFLVVQDLFLTKTAELADVVLPADRGLGRERGHGHELRATRPAGPQGRRRRPAGARDDLAIIFELAEPDGPRLGRGRRRGRLGRGPLALAGPRRHELSRGSRSSAALQWPCYDEDHPGELFLHSRLWEDPVPGNRVPFVPVDHDPPVDKLDDDFPIRLTTGRRLDSYNTGVQTAGYTSPLRRGESLDISPEDADALRPGRGRARPRRVAARPGRGADPRSTSRSGRASRS